MISLLRHPGRAWQVLKVFFRLLLFPSQRRQQPRPARLRMAFEELGGAWVKFGQMLAMRFDLLPAAYCDELFKLLNQVRPFPYAQVREIVERELGAPPEVVFGSFESDSFAAASIGQVHRATLPDGSRVAVKVQRPDIRETMQSDIDLMYSLSWFVDRTRLFGATRARDVIDEFARWTSDELDYEVEARQATLLYEHARGDSHERIARVYRDFTTSRVLTTELIEGVPLIEIMSARRDGDAAYFDDLAAAGYDLDRVVRRLDWNMLNQVYVLGYFHADLHPANLYVLPGNGIGYVDYGQVGHLPERVRESMTFYASLLFRGEVEGAISELMRWLAPTVGTDPTAARRQLTRAHEAFLYGASTYARASTGSRHRDPMAINPYSKLAVDIMGIIRDSELEMSQSLVAYFKMLVTLGTLRHELAVDYDLPATARRFFTHLMRQQALSTFDVRLTADRMYAAFYRLQRGIEFLEFIEAQRPAITAGVDSLFGIRRRARAVGRRLVGLGAAILVVGGALYLVLAAPDDTRRILPDGVSYNSVHAGLLVTIIALVVALIWQLRQFGRDG